MVEKFKRAQRNAVLLRLKRTKKQNPFWLQPLATVVSVVLGTLVAGGFTWYITKEFQKTAQERSNDIALSKLIIDILDKENPNLYQSLSVLVGTMSDSRFKTAMQLAIDSNPIVPKEIKQEVRLSALKPASVLPQSKDTTVKKTDYKLNDTCLIIFLEGDSIAKREAETLHDFLSLNKRKSLFQEYAINYYRLKPTNDTNWFLAHKLLSTEKGGTNPSARVFYSEQLNGLRLYLAATEGLIGVVFKEKYTAPGQYNQDETNRGHGVFKGFLITEFSPELLDRSDKRLFSYDFVIVIPPYYLNTPTIDNIMESSHPPLK